MTVYLALGILLAAAAGLAGGWFLRCSMDSSGVLLDRAESEARKHEDEARSLRDAREAERIARAEAEARLAEARKAMEEQRLLIERMKAELSDTFTALSSAALKSSSEDFLRLASESLGKLVAETKGGLGEHKEAMDGLLKPLSESLAKYEENVKELEHRRTRDITTLGEQIRQLADTHRTLQKETGNLVSALRKPHVRGRWGEVTLRNVVEMAGMSAKCDFTEQASVNSDEGRLRPDMVVHLPGGRDIVVDSKASMDALLDAASAETDEQRLDCLRRHAQHVKTQVERLSSKSYWSQFAKSPELAVLFISEASLTAAVEVDATLIEDSISRRVLVSTPTTLFALLTAVAYGWRQEQVTENAEAIAKLGRELYERVGVWVDHLNTIGSHLGKSTEAYNKAVGSMESRVLPAVRKFRELGATPQGAEVAEAHKIEQTPRNLDLLP